MSLTKDYIDTGSIGNIQKRKYPGSDWMRLIERPDVINHTLFYREVELHKSAHSSSLYQASVSNIRGDLKDYISQRIQTTYRTHSSKYKVLSSAFVYIIMTITAVMPCADLWSIQTSYESRSESPSCCPSYISAGSWRRNNSRVLERFQMGQQDAKNALCHLFFILVALWRGA